MNTKNTYHKKTRWMMGQFTLSKDAFINSIPKKILKLSNSISDEGECCSRGA